LFFDGAGKLLLMSGNRLRRGDLFGLWLRLRRRLFNQFNIVISGFYIQVYFDSGNSDFGKALSGLVEFSSLIKFYTFIKKGLDCLFVVLLDRELLVNLDGCDPTGLRRDNPNPF